MWFSKWLRSGAEFKGEAENSIEDAVHAAVEDAANKGQLGTGDRFKVKHIRGRVGAHDSPWHITYSAVIEKEPRS
ncbi:MAG: hypothetical protein WD689_10610 [Gaiellaceae bacterium]